MAEITGFDRFKAFYTTPPLWKGLLLKFKPFYLRDLNFKHLDPSEPLQLPSIPQGTVLGKRAEYFFKFCIENSSNYTLLLHNVQIFRNQRTLGELDYIVEHNDTGTRYHIELVYKFYLYRPSRVDQKESEPVKRELSKYTGPNDRDNLMAKLNRLRTHQLPMLYRKQAQELLREHNILVNQLEQRVCFLAHIFIPRSLWQHDFKFINKACIVGYYVFYSAFAKAETQNTYYLPEKAAWKMKPVALSHGFSHSEAVQLVRQSLKMKFAPMLWMECEDGRFERFFVIAS